MSKINSQQGRTVGGSMIYESQVFESYDEEW